MDETLRGNRALDELLVEEVDELLATEVDLALAEPQLGDALSVEDDEGVEQQVRFVLVISEAAGGKVRLQPEFPILEGLSVEQQAVAFQIEGLAAFSQLGVHGRQSKLGSVEDVQLEVALGQFEPEMIVVAPAALVSTGKRGSRDDEQRGHEVPTDRR